MLQRLHKNAKTNYLIRKKIKESSELISVLSQKYHLSRLTIRKWKNRENLEDKSSRPDTLRTVLTIEQEDLILFERKQFKKNRIEHRTIKFRHPWTNGMVERFNGKVKTKVIKRYLFAGKEDLEAKLIRYLNSYNFDVKLKQLDYKTPADYL